ncbi:NF038396 family protein [Zhihengliuella sp.]|uniref:NF038396 family protein n=1 Tax=Zhihengliuella sp. TaxID=1954483 RepID=UPI002811B3BE|nr:NF038396 family protein [Zhihengliuella sp.]
MEKTDLKAAFKALVSKPEPLFLLGYMLFPLLAVIFAALGLWMVITGQRAGGLIVLLVVTQVFAIGALWAIARRRQILDSPQGKQDAP